MNTGPLRGLYNPVQPTISEKDPHVLYQELLPAATLHPFIYCYWVLKTTAPLENPFTYRVVADGCIDIFFELNDPSESYVMGFCKKYTEFPLAQSFHYVGIRFLPTMFPQLFKVDAAELSNRYVSLHQVVPGIARFIQDHLRPNDTTQQITKILDDHFIKYLGSVELDDDKRLYGAIQYILTHYGVLNVEKELDTGISARQLRRLFEYYVGDSAKTFAKVVRFQNIFRAKPSTQSLRNNKLFYDVGYYDQAHFIKEFKNFYGVTPSKAFGR